MASSMAKAEKALALRAVLTAERRLIPMMKRTDATMYMMWIAVCTARLYSVRLNFLSMRSVTR